MLPFKRNPTSDLNESHINKRIKTTHSEGTEANEGAGSTQYEMEDVQFSEDTTNKQITDQIYNLPTSSTSFTTEQRYFYGNDGANTNMSSTSGNYTTINRVLYLNNNTVETNVILYPRSNSYRAPHSSMRNNNNFESEDGHTCKCFNNHTQMSRYAQDEEQAAVKASLAPAHEQLLQSADGDTTKRPYTNITSFSIFDQQGHLCPLDIDFVKNEVKIYMSGHLNPKCSDSYGNGEAALPVKDIGPILGWYIRGFDSADKNRITLSTKFADYSLQTPSKQYKPLMDILYEKIWICKVVVEFLKKNHCLQPSYEELIENIGRHSIPELNDKQITEELLHKHANFLCNQVVSLKTDEDDDPLIAVPCMRKLIKLIGINFGKNTTCTKIEYKKVVEKVWTKATTTPLVRKAFESVFSNQLDKTDQELILRRKRCGVCETCQLPDCGECVACRAMAKFGGQGRSKKACVRRVCPNMAFEQDDDLSTDDDADRQMSEHKRHEVDDAVPFKLTTYDRKIKWIGKPVKVDAKNVYYEKVEIDDSELCIGDFVMVETRLSNVPSLVAKVVYMWKEVSNYREGFFHGEVFMRSSDTVLGEVGDPREVFLCNRCCHGAPLSSILRKACVKKKDIPADWSNLGGREVQDNSREDDGKTYFYSKYYEKFTARFEDLPEDPACPNELRKHRFCPSCERKTIKDDKIIPRVIGESTKTSLAMSTGVNRLEWSGVRWRGHDYRKGCGVFLKPRSFKLKNRLKSNTAVQKSKSANVDEDIYTEYYRKGNNLRGTNIGTDQPFCVGYIVGVTAVDHGHLVSPQSIYLRVNVMYRPENTKNKFPHREDLNVVYWSDEVRDVPFSAVAGPCRLIYERNVPEQETLHEWLERDPSRFYFRSAYDRSTGRVMNVPSHATAVGRTEEATGKGKGRGKSSKRVAAPSNGAEAKVRPLRTLDVFAGCGGLSEGLHRSGAAECRWAVENLEAAAHAYSLNNKKCAVFTEDCNALLRDMMSGATHSGGRRLPMRGEVELLCGGPPCQGFSGMNRFNSRDYSNFKNSLVATFLSYCDYYRPKYIILENVRNFVAFKRGMVVKLTLRALLDMGYQCTFGILQAGHYGVPQTRRRLIVLAAAPTHVLPSYPEPTHVFNRRACFLTATIDRKRFTSNLRGEVSAPRRSCTVRDAMSDLPEIGDGASCEEMEYGSEPGSQFQRAARGTDDTAKLRDHICKKMAPLVQARISRIPTTHGSDWRDLPNISVELADGNKCKVLQYRHNDKRNGRSRSGALRGVCACASGQPCSPEDKQDNTLIPWCLPHTGNRNNHWAGLYGRVSWEGYFSTTVTDPEPMGKQGRVLHPAQARVVSVRECARSQGFPDRFVFAGSLQDKHRQIGNAVPPPLGAALGREIIKSLMAKEKI